MRYFLPGMGATSEMYGSEWRELENARFLDWPEYEGEKTLTEVAKKMIRLYDMKASDEIWGTSLGGMVACGNEASWADR